MSNPLSIAVVEDDASNRDAIAGLLRSHGHVVSAFMSAEQFLADADPSRFDFVLSDIQMPGMTGIELVDWLAAHGVRSPAVLMTACVNEQSRALDRGLTVLLKPFSCAALAETMWSVLGSPPAS